MSEVTFFVGFLIYVQEPSSDIIHYSHGFRINQVSFCGRVPRVFNQFWLPEKRSWKVNEGLVYTTDVLLPPRILKKKLLPGVIDVPSRTTDYVPRYTPCLAHAS